MATTKLATFKLSPSYLEGLDALAARYGLPDRTAVVRRLIDDALADERGGLPSVNQIATLMARLEETVRDPRFR